MYHDVFDHGLHDRSVIGIVDISGCCGFFEGVQPILDGSVFVGGALKNGMNNKSFIDVTTDNTTHALIRYTGDTNLTKGVFIGANGMNLTMGDYSKFLYIVPTVSFSSGEPYSDFRAAGGNFEVSLKASGNDSVGVRIVGQYDANYNLTSDGATIYLNLGKGGGWKKLSVESDGTLKLV